MPPVSSQETIPNFPLNGHELAIYTRNCFEQVCRDRNWSERLVEIAVGALQQALESDWVFAARNTYPNVSFEIALQSHAAEWGGVSAFAFSLDLTFHFPTNPTYPESKPFVRRPVGVSAPPLENFSPEVDHVVDCFTLRVAVSNPNLVRVHHALPITITEKIQPKHGELFGKIENHQVRYDPANYEPLPGPVVTDQSAEFAAKWGLPPDAVTAITHEAQTALARSRRTVGIDPAEPGADRTATFEPSESFTEVHKERARTGLDSEPASNHAQDTVVRREHVPNASNEVSTEPAAPQKSSDSAKDPSGLPKPKNRSRRK